MILYIKSYQNIEFNFVCLNVNISLRSKISACNYNLFCFRIKLIYTYGILNWSIYN